jgi:hypothetical protein
MAGAPFLERVMSNQRKRNTHIFEKDPDGFYIEPSWCSARLFATESFGAKGAAVLDPACGCGQILRAADAAGYRAIGSDIVDRRTHGALEFHICNFLERSPVRAPWSIVCNPPYDAVEEFCAHALEVATYKVAMLVPLRRLPAANCWLEKMPLESIYLLTPRPSIPPGSYVEAGNVPRGGSQDFCWLIFRKREGIAQPRLRWLHRDGNGAAAPLRIERAITTNDANGPRPPEGTGWTRIRSDRDATCWRRLALR